MRSFQARLRLLPDTRFHFLVDVEFQWRHSRFGHRPASEVQWRAACLRRVGHWANCDWSQEACALLEVPCDLKLNGLRGCQRGASVAALRPRSRPLRPQRRRARRRARRRPRRRPLRPRRRRPLHQLLGGERLSIDPRTVDKFGVRLGLGPASVRPRRRRRARRSSHRHSLRRKRRSSLGDGDGLGGAATGSEELVHDRKHIRFWFDVVANDRRGFGGRTMHGTLHRLEPRNCFRLLEPGEDIHEVVRLNQVLPCGVGSPGAR